MQGGKFSFTFTKAGEFPYLCTYHAKVQTGRIIVQ